MSRLNPPVDSKDVMAFSQGLLKAYLLDRRLRHSKKS
jgi:hypothetical protein